jgi:hypothetical protein
MSRSKLLCEKYKGHQTVVVTSEMQADLVKRLDVFLPSGEKETGKHFTL